MKEQDYGRSALNVRGTILVDSQIKSMHSNLFISGYDEDKIHSISYDLTVKDVIIWKLKENMDLEQGVEDKIEKIYMSNYRLQPQEMIFVSIKERLKMPKNMIGHIVERNSYLRTGLFVSGPVYQPGHQTTIYLRVYNLSNYDIQINSGDSIAQICFEYLALRPDVVYGEEGDPDYSEYQDEEEFRIPEDVVKKHVRENTDIEKKLDSFEARIYTVFTVFMGAFVSVLALIVLDLNCLAGKTWWEIILLNVALVISIIAVLRSVMYFCMEIIRMSDQKTMKEKFVGYRVIQFLKKLFSRRHKGPAIQDSNKDEEQR